jgi:TonB family protein
MKNHYFLLSLLIITCIYVNAQEKHKPGPNKEGYYFYATKMPELIGGMDSIAHKVVYPASEKANRIQGKVYVQVYINEKGDIDKTTIQKGITTALNKAAQDAVNTTKWTPAINNGKPVKIIISIPILFKLDENKPGDKLVNVMPYDPNSGYIRDVDKQPEPVGGMHAIMGLIEYPEQELKNKTEGKVIIQAYIDENGNVTMASNIPQDNKHFIKSATDAIRKAKFTPAEKNGKKVKSIITIPVQFKLQ